jgi:hypothetical protein
MDDRGLLTASSDRAPDQTIRGPVALEGRESRRAGLRFALSGVPWMSTWHPLTAGLPYRWAMPAMNRPIPEDTVTARRVLLDGLARGTDIFELESELAPLHPRDDTFPGEVFLRLAGDALNWCMASRSDPLVLEGLREQFLPECTFRGRQSKKFQYAVLAAAALNGGTEPDLLDEVAWWQTDDFWQYALYAAVAYIRAAASRTGVPMRQACQELTQQAEHPAP